MIVVISNDAQVHRLSKEVLTDLGHENLLANPDVSLEATGADDICVVDCSERASALSSHDIQPKGLRLYLIERDQVGSLPPVLQLSTVGVLIKPVNRAALRLSLEQAIDASATRGGAARSVVSGDRDDILQSLLHAYLRLQEHENNRAAFLARVLHDFRAPLTAINGYCGLFLEDALGSLRPKQRDALQRMQRSATRLSRLALSLFELTTHDRLATDTHIAEGTIDRVIDQAVDEVRTTCQERDISLSIAFDEAGGRLFFDASQIEQAVINLLENAVRFTPRHGAVELRGYPWAWDKRSRDSANACAADRPNCYRVDVRDFGPAIARDVLPFVFEEYYSGGQSCERSNGGLGLAICRLIVRGHGGAIWATSGPDGTVFSFVLPFHGETVSPPGIAEREEAKAFRAV